MRARARASLAADGVRFLVAGAANTLLTLGLFQLFLFALPPGRSYALSWACGLLFVVAVYPSRVFGNARTDVRARARLGITYAALFLFGLGTLRLLEWVGVPARLAILGVIAATMLGNFVLGRWVLRPRSAEAAR